MIYLSFFVIKKNLIWVYYRLDLTGLDWPDYLSSGNLVSASRELLEVLEVRGPGVNTLAEGAGPGVGDGEERQRTETSGKRGQDVSRKESGDLMIEDC